MKADMPLCYHNTISATQSVEYQHRLFLVIHTYLDLAAAHNSHRRQSIHKSCLIFYFPDNITFFRQCLRKQYWFHHIFSNPYSIWLVRSNQKNISRKYNIRKIHLAIFFIVKALSSCYNNMKPKHLEGDLFLWITKNISHFALKTMDA